MKRHEKPRIDLHNDPDFFRAAITFTARQTEFSPRLIEKDYFCTVLLEQIFAASNELIFKGGTCLAKIHANFYRLSEDLDFVIPTPTDSPRAQRSKKAKLLKETIAEIHKRLPIFELVEPLTGANNSTQYNAVISYRSLIDQSDEAIQIELALREPLLMPIDTSESRTLLLNPNAEGVLVAPITVFSISKIEAMAEKLRAALTRREVAIRDFFDIDYAMRKLGLQPKEKTFLDLVEKKLLVPSNEPVDISNDRLASLRLQVEAELRPVLRPQDFSEFDLERAFRAVTRVAAALV